MPVSADDSRTRPRLTSKHQSRQSNEKMAKDALSGSVEIVQGRLYYNAFLTDPRSYESEVVNYTYLANQEQGRDDDQETSPTKRKVHFFSIDQELVYWNFFSDFGPLNLGQLYRFCQKLNNKLNDPRLTNRVIIFYSNSSFEKRSNAMYLLSAWQVLYMGRSSEDACAPFKSAIFPNNYGESRQQSPRSVIPRGKNALSPVPPFHDASPCECTYDLNILDCLRGLAKARANNFFSFDDFNIKEYEYFEQVEHGDLNWIAKNKFLAFAGPQFKRNVTREGCYTLTPQDYIPYFQSKNVGLVVRLNQRMYDENDFRKTGIQHFEQYYLDGSCPTMPILKRIVQAFEAVPADKGIAVHCKAGLGRTGTCIGAYIMKHYNFSAREIIGWMRICRPGMVIGPQQHFLEDIQQQMWYEGEIMRLKPSKGITAKRIHNHQTRKERSGILPGIEDLTVGERKALQYDAASEAVTGRAGQADALLSRRKGK